MGKIDIKKDIILFHGSKGGITGDIAPKSRKKCDFGQGFYLGENSMQAKSIVSGETNPVFYTIKLKLSEIPEDKILFLDGMDWIYTVLAHRGLSERFNRLPIAKEKLELVKKFDVVIGEIADDRMREAVMEFSENSLTDKGLEYCLQKVDYGKQVVLISPSACGKAEILKSYHLHGEELAMAKKYTEEQRKQGRNVIDEAKRLFLREGKFLMEIEEEMEIEQELERGE